MGRRKKNFIIPKDLDIEDYVAEMEEKEYLNNEEDIIDEEDELEEDTFDESSEEEVDEEEIDEEDEEELSEEERKARFLERLKAEPRRHKPIPSKEESDRYVERVLARKDAQNAEEARRNDLLKGMRKVQEKEEQEEK